MSDNPADSLRRELEAAALEALHQRCKCEDHAIPQRLLDEGWRPHGIELHKPAADAMVDAIWPLITAALEAARADEQKKIAKAIPGLYYAPKDVQPGAVSDG